VCDLETSRMGAPYIYDISRLRVKKSPKTECGLDSRIYGISSSFLRSKAERFSA